MNIISKIFTQTKTKKPNQSHDNITIYLDSEYKQQIQVVSQTVESYLKTSQYDPDQFLYLVIKHKKTNETVLKRKLYNFEQFDQVLAEVSQMGSIEKEKNDIGDYKGFIIVGYNTQKNTIPKISSISAFNQNIKFIRSGVLQKYSDIKSIFQDCQLKLHHDYLTYYQLKFKEKKVSFLPLENASVEMINEKKHIFSVKDKFKSIMFKTNSKEDMIGWLLAINQAIRIRNAQIYMNELDQKLTRKIKDKLTSYQNRCHTIRTSHRTILLDQIGRKSLRQYFKKNKQSDHLVDIKLLTTIQTYLYMCKVRRQKGEQQSEQIISSIKQILKEVRQSLPSHFHNKDFDSKQQVVKAIQQIMKYLDDKYRKILIEKRILHQGFQTYLMSQYKQKSRVGVQSLLGEDMKKY